MPCIFRVACFMEGRIFRTRAAVNEAHLAACLRRGCRFEAGTEG